MYRDSFDTDANGEDSTFHVDDAVDREDVVDDYVIDIGTFYPEHDMDTAAMEAIDNWSKYKENDLNYRLRRHRRTSKLTNLVQGIELYPNDPFKNLRRLRNVVGVVFVTSLAVARGQIGTRILGSL